MFTVFSWYSRKFVRSSFRFVVSLFMFFSGTRFPAIAVGESIDQCFGKILRIVCKKPSRGELVRNMNNVNARCESPLVGLEF